MNSTTPQLSGLYLLTDYHLTEKPGLVPAVAAAIQGGARVIQYRNKYANRARKLWEIHDLLTLCRPLGIPLIINDEADLAAESGADGVHLGAEDGEISTARTLLGDEAIIGASCYNSLSLAHEAATQGASYVAFGRFFPSQSKPEAVQASTDLLVRAKQELSLPVAAIGGITASNGQSLIDAGADMLAVIHAVLGAEEIEPSARALATLFEKHED